MAFNAAATHATTHDAATHDAAIKVGSNPRHRCAPARHCSQPLYNLAVIRSGDHSRQLSTQCLALLARALPRQAVLYEGEAIVRGRGRRRRRVDLHWPRPWDERGPERRWR